MLLIDDLLNALGIKISNHAKKLLNDTLENENKIKQNLAEFGEAVIKELNATQSQIKGEKVPLQVTQNTYIYDDITLSENLYLRLKEVEKEAKQVIKTHLKEQKTIKDLALKLYEGYDFKSDPLKIKKNLPKYLKEQIAPLSKIKKLKMPNLKASYMQVLKAKSDEAKAKALKVAMYEKGRFYANRIAQNEANIEYMRDRATEILNDDEIEVVRVKMSSTHPRADICDYHANVDLYGLGKGLYPKDKAPLPPFHPFCRCRLIPKFSESAKGAKLNLNAQKEFISKLPLHKQAQILGSKRRAFEYLNSDIPLTDFYNKTNPKRYKTKQLDHIYEIIRQIATQTITSLYKSVDFSKSGYRINVKEPLILTRLNKSTTEILNGLGYKTNGEFKGLENLLHGMRLKKIKDGNALSKDDFLNMSLNFTENNLYIGFDEYKNKSFAFFWGATDKKVNYAYFDIRGDLKTYGITNLQTIKKYKKVLSGS